MIPIKKLILISAFNILLVGSLFAQEPPRPDAVNTISGNLSAGPLITERGFAGAIQAELNSAHFLGRIELQAGQPVLRIQGRTEIPIEFKRFPISFSGLTGFRFYCSPLTAEGRLTLTEIAAQMGDRLGSSYFVAGPEVVAQIFHDNVAAAYFGGLATARVYLGTGLGGGLAHDTDGTAGTFGSRLHLSGAIAYSFGHGRFFDLGLDAHYFQPSFGDAAPGLAIGGYVGYSEQRNSEATRWFIHAVTNVDRDADVRPSGSNNDTGLTSQYIGINVGFSP